MSFPPIRDIVAVARMLMGNGDTFLTCTQESNVEEFVMRMMSRLFQRNHVSLTFAGSDICWGNLDVTEEFSHQDGTPFTQLIGLIRQQLSGYLWRVNVPRFSYSDVGVHEQRMERSAYSVVAAVEAMRSSLYSSELSRVGGPLKPLLPISSPLSDFKSAQRSSANTKVVRLRRRDLKCFQDDDTSSIFPTVEMHGLCWCCFQVDIFCPLPWPSAHANQWNIETIRASKAFFEVTGGPQAPINFISKYGHGRCLCCYKRSTDKTGVQGDVSNVFVSELMKQHEQLPCSTPLEAAPEISARPTIDDRIRELEESLGYNHNSFFGSVSSFCTPISPVSFPSRSSSLDNVKRGLADDSDDNGYKRLRVDASTHHEDNLTVMNNLASPPLYPFTETNTCCVHGCGDCYNFDIDFFATLEVD